MPVKLAVGCEVFSLAMMLIHRIVRVHFKAGHLFEYLLGLSFWLFLAFMIYQRKNLARWTYTFFAAFWLLWFAVTFRTRMELPLSELIVQVATSILWTASVIMLFDPSANNWFESTLTRRKFAVLLILISVFAGMTLFLAALLHGVWQQAHGGSSDDVQWIAGSVRLGRSVFYLIPIILCGAVGLLILFPWWSRNPPKTVT